MKERPILFSTAMVRALLAGTKTQTRRVAKIALTVDQALAEASPLGPERYAAVEASLLAPRCPFGEVGDRLWVRESFRVDDYEPRDTIYRADASDADLADVRGVIKWKPGIHLPRARARIFLSVTAAAIERLQSINGADAEAEGVELSGGSALWPHVNRGDKMKAAYRALWDGLNASRGFAWADNPWVWVVRFKVAEVLSGCACEAA